MKKFALYLCVYLGGNLSANATAMKIKDVINVLDCERNTCSPKEYLQYCTVLRDYICSNLQPVLAANLNLGSELDRQVHRRLHAFYMPLIFQVMTMFCKKPRIMHMQFFLINSKEYTVESVVEYMTEPSHTQTQQMQDQQTHETHEYANEYAKAQLYLHTPSGWAVSLISAFLNVDNMPEILPFRKLPTPINWDNAVARKSLMLNIRLLRQWLLNATPETILLLAEFANLRDAAQYSKFIEKHATENDCQVAVYERVQPLAPKAIDDDGQQVEATDKIEIVRVYL